MPNRATLIRSLLSLQSERRSGVLSVKGEDDDAGGVAIFLRAGDVVYARELPPAVTAGQKLVRQGALSADALARIAAAMATATAQTPAPDDEVHFCETAIALGHLPQLAAWSALKGFSRRAVLRTFQLTSVEWTFDDSSAPQAVARLDYVARFKLAVEPLVAQAMRGMDPGALAADLERLLDVEVILTAPASEIQTRFELSMAEMKLLVALGNTAEQTPRSLLATPEAQAVDALAVLVALATTHVLRRAISSPSSSRSMPAVPMSTNNSSNNSSKAPPARTSIATPRSVPVSNLTPRSIPAASQTPRSVPVSNLTPRSIPAANLTPRSIPAANLTPRSIPAAPSSSHPSHRSGTPMALLDPMTPPPTSSQRPVIMAKTPPPPPASNRSIPVAPPSSRPNLGSASSSLPPRSDVRRSSDPNLGLGSIPRSRGDSVDRVRLSTGGGGAASVPPRKRSDPNQVSPEAKELGERWMLAGVEHARAGRWSRAAPDLVQALEYLPDNEELRLYALWSTIQARDNEPVKRGERADLARLALATTKKEPDFAFGYYIAGDLSLLDGDVEQAHKLLTRAIKLDPGLLDAGRLLRVVEHRRAEQAPASKGGLFRRKLW